MLIHIKTLCEEISNELGIKPTKKQIELGELTQLRNATKINDPDCPGLVCIGSRLGMGKTNFALDIVLDAAISNQKDILIFSLEMTAKQIAERLLRKLCGVNIREFRNSTRSEDDKAKLSAAIAFLQERNILIDDNFNTSPAYIEKCIQSCENPGVVLIDYLQLLHADEKEDAYQLEICKIIRSLLLQSQKYCVKMVVLTQIGRIFRKDKRPILDDIRSIGCLHQDSDVVLFVYRDEYYESDSANDAAEIIIAKNRYGECCTIHMRFDGLSVSFRENAAIESEIAKAE